MARLVYNKFYGWISNDIYVWQLGGCYNVEWIEIHKASKYIELSKNKANDTLLTTRTNWYIIGSLYKSSSVFLELWYNGYLSSLLNNDANVWYITTGLWTWCNIWELDTNGFIISSSWFHRWTLNTNETALWTYNIDSTWINTDSEFSTPGSWTIWVNWSVSWWLATHTSWSTAVLSIGMSPTTSQKYRLWVSHTTSAWTCAVKIAWNTIMTLSTWTSVDTALYTAASWSELLEFVPSSSYVWSIDYCRIQVYNITTTSHTFNEYAPYNIFSSIIYVWNSNTVTTVDMSTPATPVITTAITLDVWYVVKGITRISDQFFIYASNWVNSRQYLWDWADTAPVRVITWVDKPILNVANFANQDYVITGTSRKQEISLVNWYQLTPLYISDDDVSSDNRVYFYSQYINQIETLQNRFLFGGQGGIYSFGNKNPWLPKSLVKEFTFLWWTVTSMFYSEDIGYSLYFYYKATINGVLWYYRWIRTLTWSEVYGTLLNWNTGFYEFNPIMWEVYSNIKTLSKITLWYSLPTNTYINLYEATSWYCSLYIDWSNTIAVWDVYTYDWRTLTVYAITNPAGSNYIVHCTYTWTVFSRIIISPTITKSSWSGPSSKNCSKLRNWYKYLDMISSWTKYTVNITGTFNEAQFAMELISTDSTVTPKVYDYNLYYNEKVDD